MNDDYIKREDAIYTVRNTIAEGALENTVELRLNNIPSADVVKVVRCKDCEHRRDSMLKGAEAINFCDKQLVYVPDNHYCSYGERADA